MAKPTVETPYLEFRFLKNAMIHLGNGQTFIIPADMRSEPNPNPTRNTVFGRPYNSNELSNTIVRPQFDCGPGSKIHRVELENERPIVPKKLPGQSEAHLAKLFDQAYERAASAKINNDILRQRINSYAERGVIEIVSDPFANTDEVEGLSDLAEAIKTNTPVEPSESSDESDTPAPKKARSK